jgi:hypothetical protein
VLERKILLQEMTDMEVIGKVKHIYGSSERCTVTTLTTYMSEPILVHEGEA